MFIDPPDPLPTLGRPPPSALPEVADRLTSAQARVEQARDNLELASRVQKRHFDSRHIEPRRPLAVGDRVFVLLDHHLVRSLVRGMHKLRDNKWVLRGYKQYTYIKLYKNNRYLQYLLEYVPHSSGYNN